MCSEYIHDYFLAACKLQMNCISPTCTDFEWQKLLHFLCTELEGEGHRKYANHNLYFLILHQLKKKKKKGIVQE